jgi:chorismate synthase
MAMNADQRPEDYVKMKDVYRPGHADYTYDMKYGFRDWCGGGRASARETLARVAAGAIAKKYLTQKHNIQIFSYVEQVGNIAAEIDHENVNPADIEKNIIRCPDQDIAKMMIARVEEVLSQGDSIGGIIKGVIKNVPAGLGEPVFDKISADLGKAMLSINATKGFEIGLGFKAVGLLGSEHNDEFYIDSNGAAKTRTNNAGGTLGGISSGQTIYFRVAFKPVSTIRKAQRTITVDHKETELAASGRHDPCVLPRAVPIVDAMAALVIIDHLLRNKAQNG